MKIIILMATNTQHTPFFDGKNQQPVESKKEILKHQEIRN